MTYGNPDEGAVPDDEPETPVISLRAMAFGAVLGLIAGVLLTVKLAPAATSYMVIWPALTSVCGGLASTLVTCVITRFRASHEWAGAPGTATVVPWGSKVVEGIAVLMGLPYGLGHRFMNSVNAADFIMEVMS